PIPDSLMTSRTFKNEYDIIHSSNQYLIDKGNKVLLFQQVGAGKFINEDGMLNDFLSSEKRIIPFDKEAKVFEDRYYELPSGCNPIKSFVFRDRLCLACQRDKNVVIYQTDL